MHCKRLAISYPFVSHEDFISPMTCEPNTLLNDPSIPYPKLSQGIPQDSTENPVEFISLDQNRHIETSNLRQLFEISLVTRNELTYPSDRSIISPAALKLANCESPEMYYRTEFSKIQSREDLLGVLGTKLSKLIQGNDTPDPALYTLIVRLAIEKGLTLPNQMPEKTIWEQIKEHPFQTKENSAWPKTTILLGGAIVNTGPEFFEMLKEVPLKARKCPLIKRILVYPQSAPHMTVALAKLAYKKVAEQFNIEIPVVVIRDTAYHQESLSDLYEQQIIQLVKPKLILPYENGSVQVSISQNRAEQLRFKNPVDILSNHLRQFETKDELEACVKNLIESNWLDDRFNPKLIPSLIIAIKQSLEHLDETPEQVTAYFCKPIEGIQIEDGSFKASWLAICCKFSLDNISAITTLLEQIPRYPIAHDTGIIAVNDYSDETVTKSPGFFLCQNGNAAAITALHSMGYNFAQDPGFTQTRENFIITMSCGGIACQQGHTSVLRALQAIGHQFNTDPGQQTKLGSLPLTRETCWCLANESNQLQVHITLKELGYIVDPAKDLRKIRLNSPPPSLEDSSGDEWSGSDSELYREHNQAAVCPHQPNE